MQVHTRGAWQGREWGVARPGVWLKSGKNLFFIFFHLVILLRSGVNMSVAAAAEKFQKFQKI